VKATPNKFPLLAESGNRRISAGEYGQVIKVDSNCFCQTHHTLDCHDRFTVRFDDGEEVVAMRGYWKFDPSENEKI